MDPIHYGLICKHSFKEYHNDILLKDIEFLIEHKNEFLQWLSENITRDNVEIYLKNNTTFKEIVNDYFELTNMNINMDNSDDLSGVQLEQPSMLIDYDTNILKSVLLERNQKSNDKNKSIHNIFKI